MRLLRRYSARRRYGACPASLCAGATQVRYSDSFYERLFTDGHYTVVGCTVPDGEIVAVASVRIVQRGDDAPPAQRNLCEAVQQ